MAEKYHTDDSIPFFNRERPNVPALAVAFLGRLFADSFKSEHLDNILDRRQIMKEDGCGGYVPAGKSKPEYCTPQVLAAEELTARYVEYFFEAWGISQTIEPDVHSIEFFQENVVRNAAFGGRDGGYLDCGLYYDLSNLYTWDMADFDAMMMIDEIIDEAIEIADKAREEFKNGELHPNSWALSCGAMALNVRAHLEVGSSLVALILMFELGRIVTMHKSHEHELAIERRKETSRLGGKATSKLTPQQRKSAARKFHELRETSTMSKSAAQERIGTEFGVSRQTIGRCVDEYAPEK